MRALVVEPGQARTRPGWSRTCPSRTRARGTVLVEGLAVGVCGTDREIAAGAYGEAPGPAGHSCWDMSRSVGCSPTTPARAAAG